MKKFINLLACLALAAHLNACTSNDSRDESEDGSVAEDSLETGGDAALEENSSSEAVADNNDGFLDEQLPEDALGESTPEQEVAKVEEPPPAVVEETPAPEIAETPTTPDSTVVASESPTDSLSETPPPVIEEPAKDSFAAVDTGTSEPLPDSSLGAVASTTSTESLASEEKPKPVASLKKVEAAPFKRSGVLLNAVYIARPGDSFSSISKNVYGDESKTKELKKVNPYFSKVRPGDKVYYNSPVRPTDDTKLLTHYEDSGMIPETYVAKEGDNIRDLGKTLIGHDNGWKELWVTNSVDSKGELAAGTELRYWRNAPAPVAAVPPPTQAVNTPPPAMAEPLPPPPPVAQNDIPMPPPPEMNAAPPPPPPAMEMPAEPPPPPQADLPPPPPAEAVNPPPPPVVAKKAPPSENIGGLDNDMIMTLGGAGILVAAIALLMIVRKRRQQKEMSAAFGDTQVGT